MTPRSIAIAVALAVASGVALAKLPVPAAPTDAQKAAAAEAAAKTAHAGKVGAYQQCEAENRTAARHRERNGDCNRAWCHVSPSAVLDHAQDP